MKSLELQEDYYGEMILLKVPLLTYQEFPDMSGILLGPAETSGLYLGLFLWTPSLCILDHGARIDPQFLLKDPAQLTASYSSKFTPDGWTVPSPFAVQVGRWQRQISPNNARQDSTQQLVKWGKRKRT